ncbi:hypothetical protein [Flindersiella endophytica]
MQKAAYQAATSTWLRDHNLLELLAKTASGATEQPSEPPPPWLRLQRRETVIWSGSGVRLVSNEQPTPAVYTVYTAYSEITLPQLLGPFNGELPADVRVIDTGLAVITTTRVLFAGSKHRREWSYSRIKGISHVPDAPATLFRLAVPKVFGLLPPEPIAIEFRFLLGLALADRAKARHVLASRMDRLLAEHRMVRPVAPVPPQRRAPRTAVIAAAVVATVLAGLGFFWLRTTYQNAPAAAVNPVTVTSQATAAGTKARPTPATTRTTPAEPGPTATPTTTAAEPTPDSTSAGLCGAPDNPYDYNFCDGSLEYDPDPQVCEYFTCIVDFSSGRGFLVLCDDGMISLWGGFRGVCGEHGGVRQPVYR